MVVDLFRQNLQLLLSLVHDARWAARAIVNASSIAAVLGVKALATGTGNSKPAAIAATALAQVRIAEVVAGDGGIERHHDGDRRPSFCLQT